MLTGPRAVRRRQRGDDRAQAGQRGAVAAERVQPRGRRRSSRRVVAARAGQGPGASASPTPTRSSPRSRTRAAPIVAAGTRRGQRRRPRSRRRVPRRRRPRRAAERVRRAIADGPPPRARRAIALVAVGAAGHRCWSRPRSSRSSCSRGPTRSAVPSVVGPDAGRGAARRCSARASTSTSTRATSDAAEGDVIRQDPRRGDKAEKGSTVTLTVSDGPGQQRGPDVDGLGAQGGGQGARRTRASRSTSAREASDTRPKDHVIRTDAGAGRRQLDVGSTVTLVVSTGPQAGRRCPTSSARSATTRSATLRGRRASTVDVTSRSDRPATPARCCQPGPGGRHAGRRARR